jgi:hypothetical protein
MIFARQVWQLRQKQTRRFRVPLSAANCDWVIAGVCLFNLNNQILGALARASKQGFQFAPFHNNFERLGHALVLRSRQVAVKVTGRPT